MHVLIVIVIIKYVHISVKFFFYNLFNKKTLHIYYYSAIYSKALVFCWSANLHISFVLF
jgi:hypothetical protein